MKNLNLTALGMMVLSGLPACSPFPTQDPLFQEVFPANEREGMQREMETQGDLSLAVQGNPAAISRILKSAAVEESASRERRLTCSRRILTVMMHVGDERFAAALVKEDKATREAVGLAIDWMFFSRNLPYPKTRGCYEYRFYFPPEQD